MLLTQLMVHLAYWYCRAVYKNKLHEDDRRGYNEQSLYW
jgi:hypothetical protein